MLTKQQFMKYFGLARLAETTSEQTFKNWFGHRLVFLEGAEAQEKTLSRTASIEEESLPYFNAKFVLDNDLVKVEQRIEKRYAYVGGSVNRDIVATSLSDKSRRTLVNSSVDDRLPTISTQESQLAYLSDRTGSDEVWL